MVCSYRFSFDGVVPGEYELTGHHDTWRVSQVGIGNQLGCCLVPVLLEIGVLVYIKLSFRSFAKGGGGWM